MRIAIPLEGGRLAPHFGRCETFAIMEVDPVEKKLLSRSDLPAPPHAPGLLPAWLSQQKVDTVIAGGMGVRAQALFADQGIEVVLGADCLGPEELVEQLLNGTLNQGQNPCDH